MRGRIPALKAMRGLAALMVVAVHVNTFHRIDQEPQAGWLNFTSYGWLGVQIFFVLSGLVLYLPYARGTRLELGRYATRRILRIGPGSLGRARGNGRCLRALDTRSPPARALHQPKHRPASPIPPGLVAHNRDGLLHPPARPRLAVRPPPQLPHPDPPRPHRQRGRVAGSCSRPDGR